MIRELVYNHDYVIREVQLPPYVHGAVVLDEDDRANIYINANDPEDRKWKLTIVHELDHQVEDHYYLPEDMAEEQVHEMIGRTELRIVDCGNR